MTKRKILIIQLRPEDEIANSEFNAILSKSGLSRDEVHRIRAEEESVADVDLTKYSALIVGGSPFDVSTPQDEKSDMQVRVEADLGVLLRRVVDMDYPYLGVCSGTGQMGYICGGVVDRKFPETVSAVDVALTEAGVSDKLLQGIPAKFRALVGHKEACSVLPAEAVLLASSEKCPVQMFKIGQNVYATQFHPEADADEFALRIDIYRHNGYFDPADAERIKKQLYQEKLEYPHLVLKNFVSLYADRA